MSKTITNENPTCEVCGRPAMDLIRDFHEAIPVGEWREWRPGEAHAFCVTHRRSSRKYMLDGSVRSGDFIPMEEP